MTTAPAAIRRGGARDAQAVLLVVTVVVWIALARLIFAFARSDFSWRYVAEHTRRDAPWYYRIAGVWGGSEGSLLLFVAIVAAVAVIASRGTSPRSTATSVWFAAATVITLAAISVLVASPFARLAAPADRGFGLTPILEHPAMAAHPPLLYAGLACTLGLLMVAIDGRDPRPWLRASATLVLVAMALGAAWSYLEQGWGGYWAWDPVENTSLLVWLLCLLGLHAGGWWAGRWHRVLLGGPWLCTLLGAAFVRSGSTPSVHGFAQQASVGWALLIATAGTAVAVALLPTPLVLEHGARPAVTVAGHVAVSLGVTAVVLAGTALPVFVELFGGDAVAVRGVFFSRTVAPLALLGVVLVVPRLRQARGRVAHIGFLVLLLGIGASTFERVGVVAVTDGERAKVAGLVVEGGPVSVQPGPRIDVDAVVAEVVVAGHVLRPSLLAYPERGGVLAETAVLTRPWRDIHVTLSTATDADEALLIVRQRPLVWLLWFGAVLIGWGTAGSGRRQVGGRERPGQPESSPPG
jgi:cytochrome c-type biogenesis protein CcmF